MVEELIDAEEKAGILFEEAVKRNYIIAGRSEKELNTLLFDLAKELFDIRTYWHKRIVRAGVNTLLPYKENPANLTLKDDDILFFDFGPVFEQWEADFGRTYVIGNNPRKLKLKHDIELGWNIGADYIKINYDTLTGADVYRFTQKLAADLGWDYTVAHAGHLIGNFPHEQLLGEEVTNYLHPDNDIKLSFPDINGNKRHWIYEVHFVDLEHQIGGFFEQLVRL